jgi:hypothetical protein
LTKRDNPFISLLFGFVTFFIIVIINFAFVSQPLDMAAEMALDNTAVEDPDRSQKIPLHAVKPEQISAFE